MMDLPQPIANADFNGLRMFFAKTAEEGEVSRETILEFKQEGNLVSARYAGGRISLGFLVGLLRGSKLEFRYVQSDRDGRLDAGQSTCDVLADPNGRLIVNEHFEWATRTGGGTNILEEMRED